MRGQLLIIEARRLLLQLQFADAFALRFEPVFDAHALFFELAQPGSRRFQRVARRRHCPLADDAGLQRLLQLRLQIFGLHGFGVLGAARQFVDDAFNLLARQFAAARDFVDLAATFPLRELRFTQFALDAVDLLALVAQRALRLFEACACAVHHQLQFADLLALRFDRLVGDEQALVLAFFLGQHLG